MKDIYAPQHYREEVTRSVGAMEASNSRPPRIPYTSAERRWEHDNPVFVFDKSKIGTLAPSKP